MGILMERRWCPKCEVAWHEDAPCWLCGRWGVRGEAASRALYLATHSELPGEKEDEPGTAIVPARDYGRMY